MVIKGISDRVVAEGQKEDERRGLQNNKEERDWSDLPNDIMGYIVGKLYWSDRFRLRSVCKTWQQAPIDWIPTIDKGSWLMTYRWIRILEDKGVMDECKLRDTSLGRVVYIAKGIKGSEERALFDNAKFETSRYGWVLFRKYPCYDLRQRYIYFLYSPFTDEIIELPTLDVGYKIYGSFLKSTFYLSSANSECLVFSMHIHHETVNISTCRPGDKSWKTFNFLDSKGPFYPLGATYLSGCFYCLFMGGALGVFNISLQHWTLLVKGWTDSRPEYYIFGELVAIPRSPCLPLKRRRVMKFDFSAKRWVEELNFKEMVRPDLNSLSSSMPLGELSPTDHHQLYAYIYSSSSWMRRHKSEVILIEPPLKCIWRKYHLLNPN